jgi:hypothetical protein
MPRKSLASAHTHVPCVGGDLGWHPPHADTVEISRVRLESSHTPAFPGGRDGVIAPRVALARQIDVIADEFRTFYWVTGLVGRANAAMTVVVGRAEPRPVVSTPERRRVVTGDRWGKEGYDFNRLPPYVAPSAKPGTPHR